MVERSSKLNEQLSNGEHSEAASRSGQGATTHHRGLCATTRLLVSPQIHTIEMIPKSMILTLSLIVKEYHSKRRHLK